MPEPEEITPENPLVPDGYVGLLSEEEPGLVVMGGFLEEDGNDRWKLYTSLDLDAYVGFANDDAVLQMAAPVGPVDGTYVWIKPHAVVTFHDGKENYDVEARLIRPVPIGRMPWPVTCPRSQH